MAIATMQTNIKSNSKDFRNFGYWLTGVDVTDQNLDQFTPYTQGVSRIYMNKPPRFMDVIFPEMTKRFKSIIETGYTSIQGINDITTEFNTFNGGFAGQQFKAASLIKDDFDTLTIQAYELSGSPLREYLELWTSGTRDFRSGIAHYHGAINGATGLKIPYGERNHSAEFVYNVMDPTATELEYVAMFAHCFPTKVSKAHLNYEQGNRSEAQVDLEFSASKYESPAINEIGMWYNQATKIEYNYLAFTPNIGKPTAITSTNNGKGYTGNANEYNANNRDSRYLNTALSASA